MARARSSGRRTAKPAPKKPRKPGRPSLYTPALAARVCRAIAEGDSLVAVCKLAWSPSYTTVLKWCREVPEFTRMYARAREDQADWHADIIVAIADEATPESVNVARLRVDARKWVASKLKPRKYSDRVVADEFAGARSSAEREERARQQNTEGETDVAPREFKFVIVSRPEHPEPKDPDADG